MSDFKEGTVLELFISKKKDRENKKEMVLNFNGILEDKYYNKEVDRSILITSIDSYLLAKENNIDLEYGSLGENILIDLNPYKLNHGDKLYIGEVILEITKNCTICNSLAKIDPNLPKVLKIDRGIFARTFKGGKIQKDDKVTILKN